MPPRKSGLEVLSHLEARLASLQQQKDTPARQKRARRLRKELAARRAGLERRPAAVLKGALRGLRQTQAMVAAHGRAVMATLTEDLLTCEICLDTFEDPVVAPRSGRTYCRRCLTTWTDAGHSTDPVSREPMRLPNDADFQQLVVPNHKLRAVLLAVVD